MDVTEYLYDHLVDIHRELQAMIAYKTTHNSAQQAFFCKPDVGIDALNKIDCAIVKAISGLAEIINNQYKHGPNA